MNKEKLVSRRNGEVAEVVKIENGIYTLLVQGNQIKVKEATVKRWWKKEDAKQEKKENLAESKKEDKKEMKKEIKKESKKESKKEVKIQKKVTKKEVKKENPKKENSKIGSSQKKIIRIKTSFPLRSYWNFCIYGRYKDLRNGISALNKDQKQELISYFLQNDKDGKHSKWLKKEGLIK